MLGSSGQLFDLPSRLLEIGCFKAFGKPSIDVAARAYAVIEVGGLSGCGRERWRNFERLFYTLCSRRRVELCERAGSRTLAQQRFASGFAHEVDGATRS